MDLIFDRFPTPIGTFLLVSDGTALMALDFHDDEDGLRRMVRRFYGPASLRRGRLPRPITAALEAYFSGDLEATNAIRVGTAGTPFQQRVWAELRRIPVGSTTSYGALAARLGQPGAGRAVGLANGSNPVAVVVPCHRVIGADGSLTGFGGGLDRKRWLLAHEGVTLARAPEAQLALFPAP
jgi:methylated-DNA-[protein]-cysteine S-methyltransferase